MGQNQNIGNESSLSKTGDRLRAVADRLHAGNKSELARSLGMKPSSFSKYLNGNRRPGAVILEKLSRMGVNVNWLLTGTGAMIAGTVKTSPRQSRNKGEAQDDPQSVSESENDYIEGQLHQIPLVRIREDPDEGLQLIETDRSEWVSYPFIQREYGVRPELLRDFRISGDSMVDTIRPGDRVRAVLWDCLTPNDGTVCFLRGPVSLLLRRIRLKDETVLLVADNPEVPDQEVSQEKWLNDYEPIARVLEVRRAL